MIKHEKKDYFFCILAIILIVLLTCVKWTKLEYIAVLNDEFGYWGNAVSIAGFDWKGLMSETPFYSLGYSLWLVPIIKLFATPELWYKTAIVLNILLLIASYMLCCQTAKKVFCRLDNKKIFLISALVIIFPSNIIYAQVAWSETLLYFLIWCATYIIVCLDEKFSLYLFFCELFILIYMYCVHARNIGVLLIGIISLFFVLIKHKKPLYMFAITLLIISIGYLCTQEIKNFQIDWLWNNSTMSNMNNIGLNSATTSSYFQRLMMNFRLFIESVGGKLVYLLFVTGLTFLIPFLSFLKDTFQNIKARSWFLNKWISKFWMLGIIGIMWALSSLQMLDWASRKDMIVYSRYMEHVLGPILLLCIVTAFEEREKIRMPIVLGSALFFFGIRSVYLRVEGAVGGFNSICSPVVGAFYDNIYSVKNAFYCIGIIGIVFFVIWLLFSVVKHSRRIENLIIISFFVFYVVVGYGAGTFMDTARSYFSENTKVLRDEIVKYEDTEIFYIKDIENDIYSANPKYLQFMVPEQEIRVVNHYYEIDSDRKKMLILINSKDIDSIEFIENILEKKPIAFSQMLRIYKIEKRK